MRFMELFQRGIAPLPPAVAWDYYQRLYRQISLEAVPFQASNYLARVAEPSEAAIAQLYEEGKDRYPSLNSTEAGFKRRKKVALQYVKADLQKFLDEEKPKITDEEVRAYYEANKQEYRNVDLPPSQTGANSPQFPGSPLSAPAAEIKADSPIPLQGPATILDEESDSDGLLPKGVLDAVIPGDESPLPSVDGLPTVDELPTVEPLPPLDELPALDEPGAAEPSAEGPVEEEPATEEPATEEPATEEPATEEPATEEARPDRGARCGGACHGRVPCAAAVHAGIRHHRRCSAVAG